MSTPDPATLREALDYLDDGFDGDLDHAESVWLARAAARRWLDLIEEGKEVWWCETHERVSDLDTCCSFGNMVKRLLVAL